jgi:carboxypeptidase Taq
LDKTVFHNDLIRDVLSRYRRIWALNHAESVLGWDMEVFMPKEGITERSVAQGELAVLSHELLLSPSFVDLVNKSKEVKELNEYERGVVRVLDRSIRIAKAFPPEFVKELAETRSKATSVWSEAKRKDDYKLFEPWLDKIIELSRKAADYLGYDEYPYDALLDLYEEGLRVKDLEIIFSSLESSLRPLLKQILEESWAPREHPLEKEKYDIEKMKQANVEILKILGFPIGLRSRIDVSPHPFTTEFGIRDVRITTRYEGRDFRRSLLAAVHEFGHALYELQQDERFMFTPIAGGVSLGIHESQSRFWENIIGRSKEFARLIYPTLSKYLPFLRNYDVEEIYKYFNIVRPDLIRVEADEVTYNLHIILRYRLEKLMINEGVKAKELPELWNEEIERLLGIRPKTYREGILQDIHWAHGTIGYFPTYSLGTLLAVQIRAHILKEIPNMYELILKGEFTPIKEWLKAKIHRYGSIYPPKELILKSLGEGLNPDYFITYIKEKYLGNK